VAVIGYAPGAYDLFHIGHLNILRQAREHCDHLIAGVVADDVILRAKARQAIVPLAERLDIVGSIRYVDEAVVDNHTDKFKSWEEFGYDILFKGDDWRGTPRGVLLEHRLRSVGARLVYFPYTMHTSSTVLRKHLAGSA